LGGIRYATSSDPPSDPPPPRRRRTFFVTFRRHTLFSRGSL
jgi:hypothetical protein